MGAGFSFQLDGSGQVAFVIRGEGRSLRDLEGSTRSSKSKTKTLEGTRDGVPLRWRGPGSEREWLMGAQPGEKAG